MILHIDIAYSGGYIEYSYIYITYINEMPYCYSRCMFRRSPLDHVIEPPIRVAFLQIRSAMLMSAVVSGAPPHAACACGRRHMDYHTAPS